MDRGDRASALGFHDEHGAAGGAGRSCVGTQQALIEGADAATVAGHLEACGECAALVAVLAQLGHTDLRSSLRATGGTGGDPATLRAVVEVLRGPELLLGRYRLQHRLGAGGEGLVFAAVDTETGQAVAVKFGASESLSGFVNAQRVVHENVCPVHYTTVVAGVRIVVMRFVAGTLPLAAMSLPEALQIMQGLAAGLAAIHAAGLVHLDIKPGNVLLERGRAVIVDFGLSAPRGQPCPAGRGTRGYMPPEQRAGGVATPATDVFAAAHLFRALLRGPVPARIERVLARATADDPARRPQSALALLAELRAASRVPRRWKRLAGAAGTASVAGALLVVLPAPAGDRAEWHPDLWGVDTVPRAHWNVAVNRSGRPRPTVQANLPAVGCARNLSELVDGLASYDDWSHGYAFPGPRALCLPRATLAACGASAANAPPCHVPDGTPGGGAEGQLQPSLSCQEDAALTIELDRPRRTSALRAWFRQGVPERLQVEAQDASGSWRRVFATRENRQWTRERYRLPAAGIASVPVTIFFAPVATQKLRLLLRCSPARPERPGSETPSPMWLYEVEVFAPLPPFVAHGRALERWLR